MTPAARGLLLGAALIAVASCASWMPAPVSARSPSPASRAATDRAREAARATEAAVADPAIRALVRLVNQRRADRGCGRLQWHSGLARVAQRHSEDMVRRAFFGHENPDGEDPFERMRRAGIDFTAAAENVAAGHRTGADVFAGWIGSSGHRRNIDRCLYTHHGVGLHQNRWTHVFARFDPAPQRRRPG